MSAETANLPVSTVPADDLNKSAQPAKASDALSPEGTKPEANKLAAKTGGPTLDVQATKAKSDAVAAPKSAVSTSLTSGTLDNFKSSDPFADAGGDAESDDEITKKKQETKIHIRIQQRNGRKTLTTIQGLPDKFDRKKILKVIKKKFACNGTIVADSEMGEVIQLQGDQRKDMQTFVADKKEGLGLDMKTIQVHGF